jgi:hypothetical protein
MPEKIFTQSEFGREKRVADERYRVLVFVFLIGLLCNGVAFPV